MKATTAETNTIEQSTDGLVQDFKSASFIVSVMINLTLFVAWLTIQLQA